MEDLGVQPKDTILIGNATRTAEQGPQSVLRRYFGFSEFRYPQQEVIEQVLAGKDVLVVMPTGRGKSLCYQLPALILEGLTLVVSPLIALMKDQVDALLAKGIAAGYINSSQSPAEQKATLARACRGELDLLYVAPERLRSRYFIQMLSGCRLSLLAVDEAHCLSQWGHDFRPDYLRITEALRMLPRPQVAAFTATATPEVQADIRQHLQLQDPETTVAGFERPNLAFCVRRVSNDDEKYDRIHELVAEHTTGIIYCATRGSTETVCARLREEGIQAGYYHGGMLPAERDEVQASFINGQLPVVVATNAFGMGIDRSDIRLVVHFEMPGSVEAYYQEIGRAGRDGNPAHCELLFNYADRRIHDFFHEGSNPPEEQIRQVYNLLRDEADAADEVFLSGDDLTERMKAYATRCNPMAMTTSLSLLSRMKVIERFDIPGKRMRGTRLLQPRLTAAQLPIDGQALKIKAQRDLAKLDAMIRFCYANECRQQWVLGYFGEMGQQACGCCDVCRSQSGVELRGPASEEERETVLKVLSAVARMSKRMGKDDWEPLYGRTTILQCMRGSKSARFQATPLAKLTTYGILHHYSQNYLDHLLREMERAGLLFTYAGKYPLLGLSVLGSQVMRGAAQYRLNWPEPGKDKQAAERRHMQLGGLDPLLLEKLREKRRRLAQARGDLPAYQILNNKTLEALAAIQPQTVEEAMEVPGIGKKNARTVLPSFLQVIRRHYAS